jgi:mono/diheme cytochrome c family protein
MSFLSASAQTKPWTTPDKYAKMKSIKVTPDDIKLGKDLYNKNCKSCHGSNGAGDGTRATALKTKISPLGSKEYKELSNGTKYYRSFIGRDEMPNFEKKFVDEKTRWSIIEYMNTFK